MNKFALALLVGAVTVLIIFLSTFLPPALSLLALFLSGIFISILMAEAEMFKATGVFIACSIIGVLISGGVFAYMTPYIFFAGWYGIAKYAIESIRDRFISICVKLIVYNASMFFVALAAWAVFEPLSAALPFYLLIPLMQAWFFIFDFSIYFFANFYYSHIKHMLQ
jgi:hypothetical protein